MDDFLEQMLSGSTWGDGTGVNRSTWDAVAVSSAIGMSVDSIGGLQDLPKIPAMPLMPPGHLVGAPQESNRGGLVGESTQYLPNKPTLSPQFDHRDAHPQDTSHISSQRISEATATGSSVAVHLNSSGPQALPSIGGQPRLPSVLQNDGFECSGFQRTSHNVPPSTVIAPTWRQPYIGGMPSMHSALGHGNSEAFNLQEGVSDDILKAKRSRDDEDLVIENAGIMMSQGLQSGQSFGDQPLGQNSTGTAVNGAGRPRVRARRGQATDPHSIAERNRRERIAERMKALQELVPESNKTDKASMLDEIIGYVKFLQMQVKCLSMCRLGGAGAAAPLLADLPAEGAGNFMAANLAQANGVPGPSQDNIAFAERQVARLMDEDMSAAMQYLQSKGLCLMPISLATAISSTGARQPSTPAKGSDGGGNEKQAMELQVAAATGNTSPAVMATLVSSGASVLGNDGVNMSKFLKDSPREDSVNEKTVSASLGLPSTMKGGLKNREDHQR